MHKYTLLILLILFFSNFYGQDIHKIEFDLTVLESGEPFGNKISKAENLLKIDPFNVIATDYICQYYREKKIDSIKVFFKELSTKYPNKIEPILLHVELLHYEIDYRDKNLYYNNKTQLLLNAIIIDSLDYRPFYELAKLYYNDFIYPLEVYKKIDLTEYGFDSSFVYDLIPSNIDYIKEPTFEHPADSALKYFQVLWELNKKREIIYFPILQLNCYLNKSDYYGNKEDSNYNFDNCYFPANYFISLKDDWECDFTKNYLEKINISKDHGDYLGYHLLKLKEKCLFDNHVDSNTVIYRFTWLRSFERPIVVRVEKKNEKIVLYWKVGKGTGVHPKGLKRSGQKKMKMNDWLAFQSLVLDSNFDSIPIKTDIPMIDGASWTLERKTTKGFKAYDTNNPKGKFKDACLFLVEKSRINLKNEDIY